MTTRQALCALDLTPEELSAWRSQALPAEDYRRIAQHIPTCRACQATLADYAALADALQRQQVPTTGAPLWRATKTKIANYERSHMNPSQKYIIAGGLGLLGVLVLSFAVILASSLKVNPASTTRQTTPNSTSTSTTTTHHSTATPVVPLHPDPNVGWVKDDSLPHAKGLAFARNAPYTGYACTNALVPVSSGSGNAPLSLLVTHDGGRTWSAPVATPMQSYGCRLIVNPTNAQDMVMQALTCTGCQQPLGPAYRSLDGGKTWMPLTPPAGAVAGNWFIAFYYAGTSLFAQMDYAPSSFQNHPHIPIIAVSVQGQPLAWTNTAAYYSQIQNLGSYGAIVDAYGAQGSFIVSFPTNGPEDPNTIFLRTADDGQTWKLFHNASLAKINLSSIIPLADGKTLLGSESAAFSNFTYTSTDGGTTWTQRNASQVPDPGPIGGFVNFLQPDGSYYDQTVHIAKVNGPNSYSYNLYRWNPNGGQWTTISTGGQLPLTLVSSTPDGQPNALWKADTAADDGNFFGNFFMVSDGYYYHAP